MKAIPEIKERLVTINGMFRNLSNKEALDLDLSCEEYEVMDALVVEMDTLNWVLSGKCTPIAYRCE